MKKANRAVKPYKDSAESSGRCSYCSPFGPYLVLYKLFWRKCPRCLAVSPTLISSPFYRKAG